MAGRGGRGAAGRGGQPYKDPQYKEVPDRPGFYGVVHATRDRDAQ